MKLSLFLTTTCLALTMVGCSKSSSSKDPQSVDADGLCTSRFISDYNDIVNSGLCVSDSGCLVRQNSSCSAFTSVHPTWVSCKASSLMTGEDKQVSSGEVHEKCARIKDQLAAQNAPRPPAGFFESHVTKTLPTCEEMKEHARYDSGAKLKYARTLDEEEKISEKDVLALGQRYTQEESRVIQRYSEILELQRCLKNLN